jgi:hypothetical protein
MRELAFRPITPTVVRRIHAVYRTGSETRPSIATALALPRETADQVGKAIAARGAGSACPAWSLAAKALGRKPRPSRSAAVLHP